MKLTALQTFGMTSNEIERHIFKGAHPSEHRSLRQYLTIDAIIAIASDEWREDTPEGSTLRDWCWRVIDLMWEEGIPT